MYKVVWVFIFGILLKKVFVVTVCIHPDTFQSCLGQGIHSLWMSAFEQKWPPCIDHMGPYAFHTYRIYCIFHPKYLFYCGCKTL